MNKEPMTIKKFITGIILVIIAWLAVAGLMDVIVFLVVHFNFHKIAKVNDRSAAYCLDSKNPDSCKSNDPETLELAKKIITNSQKVVIPTHVSVTFTATCNGKKLSTTSDFDVPKEAKIASFGDFDLLKICEELSKKSHE